jgi:hypothetical protein
MQLTGSAHPGLRLVLCPDLYLNAEVDDEVERAFSKAVR